MAWKCLQNNYTYTCTHTINIVMFTDRLIVRHNDFKWLVRLCFKIMPLTLTLSFSFSLFVIKGVNICFLSVLLLVLVSPFLGNFTGNVLGSATITYN